MPRRTNLQDQWAAWVIDGVTSWGHGGEVRHDRKRGVVTITGVGDVTLDDPEGRVARYLPEEQRNEMRRRGHRVLATQFRSPPDWVTGDAEVDSKLRHALISVREFPDSARAQARVARLARLLGHPDWEERLRWAAQRSIDGGVARHYDGDVIDGILMYLEVGETSEIGRAADLLLREFDADAPETSVADVYDTEVSSLVMAHWWRDGRARLADLAPVLDDFGDQKYATAFVRAAAAAEAGDVAALRDQSERLERMLKVDRRGGSPYDVESNLTLAYVDATVRTWLDELAAGSPVESSDRDGPPAMSAEPHVGALVPISDTTSLAWSGDVAVAASATGSAAVSIDGHPVLSHDARPPARVESTDDESTDDESTDRVRRIGNELHVVRADNSTIPLDHDWDDDQLADGESFTVTWSTSGDRLVLWGEYGSFVVFDADGSAVGSFHDHFDGPNYGVEVVGDVLMTWAGDHRAVVHDLARRLVVAAFQTNGWMENAALAPTGEHVLTYDNVDGWCAHHVDGGVSVGPHRPARYAAWHPTRAAVAYADETHLWIEQYSS